jgi:hypothetical protein
MTAIHLLDLGATVDDTVLNHLLQSQGRSELVRGILQKLRDTALDACTGAVGGLDAKDDTFIHASLGRYDGLAAMLLDLYQQTRPAESAESEEEAMLGENTVPTA